MFANYDQSGDGTISPTELVLKFSRLPGKEVAKSVKLSGIMREADQESTCRLQNTSSSTITRVVHVGLTQYKITEKV